MAQTNTQTNTHTDGHRDSMTESDQCGRFSENVCEGSQKLILTNKINCFHRLLYDYTNIHCNFFLNSDLYLNTIYFTPLT